MDDIKTILYRSWRAHELIENDCDTLQRLKDCSQKVTSVLSHAPCHAGVSDKTADSVARIVDLERKIEDDIINLTDMIDQNRDIINNVQDERYRLLLSRRYLQHKEWEQIACEMNYRIRGIHKLHTRALRAATLAYSKLDHS